MTMISFEEIKRKQVIKGICVKCDKKKTRTIDECQTISLFNKNDDGTVKSRYEVGQSVTENLSKRIEKFNKEGFICRKCKEYLGY